MKIYFAGSIRGGRNDADLYTEIIDELKKHGTVLTEHIGNTALLNNEVTLTDSEIHNRDINWLNESSVMIAECTQPSLGVGYELAIAMQQNKKVLCLFNTNRGKKLSAMITGQPFYNIAYYNSTKSAFSAIKNFLNKQIC
ncbi:MAG: nucleoside 2-deoxyribosyltransferase [Salinivirgaceae bacterium]|jgi:hypothetical protein|nr:nucleoside 2-deoxyribosyltransferase [Salinivirgaceae bacterium]